VIRPTRGGGVVGDQQEQDSSTTSLQVILALTPEDAQKFVFSAEQGLLYMSLLPPDEEGVELDPLTVAQILLPEGNN
jgi:hypothetical protein